MDQCAPRLRGARQNKLYNGRYARVCGYIRSNKICTVRYMKNKRNKNYTWGLFL